MTRLDPHPDLDPHLRELDEQLARQMPVQAPSGLADRVFAATVDQLPAAGPVGRIDTPPRIVVTVRRWALAASLLLGAFCLWYAVEHPQTMPNDPSTARLTIDQMDVVAAILAGGSDEVSAQIDLLAEEVDAVALAMEGPAGSAWEPGTLDLDEQLLYLSEQIDRF